MTPEKEMFEFKLNREEGEILLALIGQAAVLGNSDAKRQKLSEQVWALYSALKDAGLKPMQYDVGPSEEVRRDTIFIRTREA